MPAIFFMPCSNDRVSECPMKRLEKIFDRIMAVLAFTSGVILIFIMGSVCVDVIMRYFLNRPLTWVIEISEYLLVYLTFLGTAWVLRNEGHVTVDILILGLNKKARAMTGIISSLVGLFVCLLIAWFGSVETWDNFQRGVHIPSILQFPKAPLLAIIPFGCFFLMIQFVRRTLGFINKWRHADDGRNVEDVSGFVG